MEDKDITLSLIERKILANQCRILLNQSRILEALSLPGDNDEDDYEDLIEIARRGFSQQYGRLFEGFNSEGLTREQCDLVGRALEMFWCMQDSFDQLVDKGGLRPSDVMFPGFDGNNELAHIAYAKFLLKDGFEGLRTAGGLSCHHETISRYERMLEKYELIPVERRRELSAQEIRSILE